MEAKLKHLEFIQNVITRMNSNSFMIKGWTIAIVSALFALAANNSNHNLIWAVLIVVPIFWVLDGYFLSMESKYTKLYEAVTKKEETDFDMNASAYKDNCSWLGSTFSITLGVFYGSLLFLTFFVAIMIGIIQIRFCCC
ncbi:MAG: hypothetical protein L6Q66_12530 [Bacteroidia bacterium]|nr:hypothetical protein [Bacteroidia bacterium]